MIIYKPPMFDLVRVVCDDPDDLPMNVKECSIGVVGEDVYVYWRGAWRIAGQEPEPDPVDVPADALVYTVSDGNAVVTGISSEWERPERYRVTIPDEDPDGHPVTGIGTSAFWNESGLVSASGNVTDVGESAFQGCRSMTSVTLPSAVTIGIAAFNATGLVSVSLPSAEAIEKQVFMSCGSLESVSLPSAVTVKEYAFAHCPLLSSASLPAATSIEKLAFLECASLSDIYVPLVESIGREAFRDCSSLTSVSLPSATVIELGAFYRCSSMSSVSMPSIDILHGSVFSGCAGIESVTIGPVTSVHNTTFSSWVFYDTDGTSVLSETAENLADSTFVGTAIALVKVLPNMSALTPEQIEAVHSHDGELETLKKQVMEDCADGDIVSIMEKMLESEPVDPAKDA